MLFNSFKFAAFFPVVVLGYFALPQKARNFWLLAASYLFYMAWNPAYALLMLASTGITWLAGQAIGRSTTVQQKKWAVGLSLLANLGILIFFKYSGFLLQTVNALRGALGLGSFGAGFSILLPVGISFYIFQAIGYTIDVYRGEIAPERNFFVYALFVSFFPQLVAGPIERSANMLPQFRTLHHFDYDEAKAGLVQMLWGYMQKMIFADRFALLVDAVYGDPGSFGTLPTLLAVFFFALQLYCDFSSYSDIAIGAARVMGFKLMRNFDSPYLARSIGEFWGRWHISLSSWFRDYLYIPLGGNRKGLPRTCLNLVLVFAASGLWHGAAWTFVLWGLLHGVWSAVSRLTEPLRAKLCQRWGLPRHGWWWVLPTFCGVSLALVLFRADSLAQAGVVFGGLFRTNTADFAAWGLDTADLTVALCAAVLLFICDVLRRHKGPLVPLLLRQNRAVQWGLLLGGILLLAVFGLYGEGYVEKPFIYFQF